MAFHARQLAQLPVQAYRWTMKPFVGWQCRHLPTCSDYALEAIEKHGAWRGWWMTFARLSRCHPWGSHGFDPVPEQHTNAHPLAPWRYGRWWWRSTPEPQNQKTASSPD